MCTTKTKYQPVRVNSWRVGRVCDSVTKKPGGEGLIPAVTTENFAQRLYCNPVPVMNYVTLEY